MSRLLHSQDTWQEKEPAHMVFSGHLVRCCNQASQALHSLLQFQEKSQHYVAKIPKLASMQLESKRKFNFSLYSCFCITFGSVSSLPPAKVHPFETLNCYSHKFDYQWPVNGSRCNALIIVDVSWKSERAFVFLGESQFSIKLLAERKLEYVWRLQKAKEQAKK